MNTVARITEVRSRAFDWLPVQFSSLTDFAFRGESVDFRLQATSWQYRLGNGRFSVEAENDSDKK